MKGLGSLLVILGLASIAFGFMDRVPTVMQWIYKWGDGAAWAIKIGLVVLGVVIYLMAGRKKAEGPSQPQ